MNIGAILQRLSEEKTAKIKGGLYQRTQIDFAYNSNHIEGSKLTSEQTRYIFETQAVGLTDAALPIDDIIEAKNHFELFDQMLDTIDGNLDKDLIKSFHKTMKTGTTEASEEWFVVGDWKKLPNEVGQQATTPPEEVDAAMTDLIKWYETSEKSFENIVAFHQKFEAIHPFQDGNGRVGRMVLFRECLKNDVMPFIVDEDHRLFYYRGLKEFDRQPNYLFDTCRSAQDKYAEIVKYFRVGE
jgi:Fic family protein